MEKNSYEKALIDDDINPKIYFIGRKAKWNYLWEMKTKYGADISMTDQKPVSLKSSRCYEDYDIILFNSTKVFDEKILHVLFKFSNILSSMHHKKLILVYSSSVTGVGQTVRFYVSDQGIINPDVDVIDGQFSARDLISLAYQYREKIQIEDVCTEDKSLEKQYTKKNL